MDLLSEDVARCGSAVTFLRWNLTPNGLLYSATAPAAQFVAGILDDPRTLTVRFEGPVWGVDRDRTLRAVLIDWLGKVSFSAAYGERQPGDDAYHHAELLIRFYRLDPHRDRLAVAACRAARRDIFARVVPFLHDPDMATRHLALRGQVSCCSHLSWPASRPASRTPCWTASQPPALVSGRTSRSPSPPGASHRGRCCATSIRGCAPGRP